MQHVLTLPSYALPALPLAFVGLPLYVHLPAHYADLPHVGLAAVGVVLLMARLLDLVTDPLVGMLTDRVNRWCRPQGLMALGGLLLVAGAWWLFRPPATAGPLYLFTTLGLTYLGWTLLAIPYYALGAEVGRQEGQTGIAAWREGGMIVGTLVWLVPPALLATWWLRGPSARAAQTGARASAGLVAMWRQTSRVARQLLGIHVLNALAGGTAATLFVIFTRDVIGLDERAGGGLLTLYFVSGLLALPVWVWLARRLGRPAAWRAAMLLAALGFLPAAFLGPGDLMPFAVICVLTGATLGADIAMPAAIQAEIVV